jgi:hypothetical protein
VLAAGLVLGRVALPMDESAAVIALAIAGVLAFWAVFYGSVLDGDERALARGLLSRQIE